MGGYGASITGKKPTESKFGIFSMISPQLKVRLYKYKKVVVISIGK